MAAGADCARVPEATENTISMKSKLRKLRSIGIHFSLLQWFYHGATKCLMQNPGAANRGAKIVILQARGAKTNQRSAYTWD